MEWSDQMRILWGSRRPQGELERNLTQENITTSGILQSPKPKKKYHAALAVDHWQLRDLMVQKDERTLLYAGRKSIVCLDTHTGKSEVLCGLESTPSCVAIGGPNNRYVVVGTKGGEITLVDLETKTPYSLEVGKEVNNGIQIIEKPSLQVVVCSNDCVVKRLKIPSLITIDSIKFPLPMNSAMVSPNGKWMVVCGDSTDICLLKYSQSHQKYEKSQALTMLGGNHSFSVGWDRISTHFSIASQGGLCCVWELGQEEPIACFRAFQNGDRGACRLTKFSSNQTSDLLAFAEDASCVTLVDSRDFRRTETIQVAESSSEGRVCGLILSDDGTSLFVATPKIIYEYRIDTVQRRSFATGELI